MTLSVCAHHIWQQRCIRLCFSSLKVNQCVCAVQCGDNAPEVRPVEQSPHSNHVVGSRESDECLKPARGLEERALDLLNLKLMPEQVCSTTRTCPTTQPYLHSHRYMVSHKYMFVSHCFTYLCICTSRCLAVHGIYLYVGCHCVRLCSLLIVVPDIAVHVCPQAVVPGPRILWVVNVLVWAPADVVAG
jgi:hypothetical protein